MITAATIWLHTTPAFTYTGTYILLFMVLPAIMAAFANWTSVITAKHHMKDKTESILSRFFFASWKGARDRKQNESDVCDKTEGVLVLSPQSIASYRDHSHLLTALYWNDQRTHAMSPSQWTQFKEPKKFSCNRYLKITKVAGLK